MPGFRVEKACNEAVERHLWGRLRDWMGGDNRPSGRTHFFARCSCFGLPPFCPIDGISSSGWSSRR
jgi:hypothetical protein